MKEFSKDEIKKFYKARVAKVVNYLNENKISLAVFIDNEEHRDPAIPYFTGHPSDAILIITSDGSSVLIPWDEILAKKVAVYSKMVPFTRYKCNSIEATKSVINIIASKLDINKIALPPYLTYNDYLKFIDALNNYYVYCKENGVHQFVVELRMIKDEYEIECTKEAARIADLIIDRIEEQVVSGQIKTEMDVALFIERECRIHGCQRTGFETLAAGPERSFAIHAFPGYTSASWPDNGLSILDFGVVYNGYTSDTTLTIAKGELSEGQEKILSLVQKAYDECLQLYKPGLNIKDAASKADEVFAKAKQKMPHSLGHGIGLEIHESPRVSTRVDSKATFKEGMIVTLEPGLYDEKEGGCRLENDILITQDGNEVISHSRIIRIS